MVKKYKEGSLTSEEKSATKALLSMGWRNQDILAMLNIGREYSTNSGRISGVKKDANQNAMDEASLSRFLEEKSAFDPRTGLNPFRHERLIRARDAMLLAIQLFNSPIITFKAEMFLVLSNIAWTYLCHQKLEKHNKAIINQSTGKALSLSDVWGKSDLELSAAVQKNLSVLKELRDRVEHRTLGPFESSWLGLFQANCLNFENALCKWFGSKVSLSQSLTVSLQLAKPDFEQLGALTMTNLPAEIAAINTELLESVPEEMQSNLEYSFSVLYQFVPSSKSKAHIQYEAVSTSGANTGGSANVVIKYKAGDHLHPLKPGVVVKLVKKKTKMQFSQHDHTVFWRKYKVRPSKSDPHPEKVNATYCCYHPAHGDYTYNEAWVDFIVQKLKP